MATSSLIEVTLFLMLTLASRYPAHERLGAEAAFTSDGLGGEEST